MISNTVAPLRVGSLFAGIGGFDLAARAVGWSTAWFSEIDPYASAVLEQHWPGVPNHGDITQIRGKDVEPIDVLCGGFPCQDISVAGGGAGIAGARSGLWSHYARLIDELRPRIVAAENVSALRSRGLDRVLKDLMALGYDAEWHCIPAAHVGAPHQRDRIWIVAYPHGERLEEQHAPAITASTKLVGGCANAYLADAACSGWCEGGCVSDDERVAPGGCGRGQPTRSSTGGRTIHGGWATEPDVGRVANGIPNRVHRLRCLGNAIVPQVALILFRAIAAREARRNAGLLL